MLCPKCGKEMEVITFLSTSLMPDGSMHTEVLGRCDDCDFDATWWLESGSYSATREFDLQQYFFG